MPETVIAKEQWILVGSGADNSLLIRGGDNPVAIHVCHNNSSHLLELIADANAGIAARAANDRIVFKPDSIFAEHSTQRKSS